jgi:GTP-binding protein
VSESSERDPVEDLAVLRREVVAYGRGLTDKPAAVVGNKLDALVDVEREKRLEVEAVRLGLPFVAVSAVTGDGCSTLVEVLHHLVERERGAVTDAQRS